MPVSQLRLTLLIIVLGAVTACSEAPPATDGSKQTTGTTDLPVENKFAVAAKAKIMAANPGLNKQQADCVVKNMTEGGKIGLGEINQMKLNQATMTDNRDSLNQAYTKALSACQ